MEPYIDIARHYSEQFMPSALTVQRVTRVSDGMGGSFTRRTVVAETVCRLEGVTADEQVVSGGVSTTASAKVSLPVGIPITDADTLVVGGSEYNVSGVIPASEGHSAHVEVLVERVG